MKNTLLVVADLACMKAFKVENNHPNSTPHLELIEQFENIEAHNRVLDRVSDSSGRFPRGASGGGMSAGERHNAELEARKRMVHHLAQRLNAVARPQDIERCLLAASKEINHQLLEHLEPQVRAKIQKNVPADLTKVHQAQLLQHF
ncbi:MAG TPA: host attachment protein [Bacillota bacterium]|nr:host attachment protein [Bacillota bacterium]